MSEKNKNTNATASIRQKVIEKSSQKKALDEATFSEADLMKQILELKTNQAALELKNKELRKAVANAQTTIESLKMDEARFQAVTIAAQDAILMIDPAGNISFLNTAAKRIFGYTRDEMMGKNLHFLLAPQRYHSANVEAFTRFIQSGKGENLGKTRELHAVRKDGLEITVELSLSALDLPDGRYAIGILRDISERKHIDDTLRKNRREFQSYFDAGSVGLSVTAPDGTWIEVNQCFCQMLGYSKDELVGLSWAEISHPDDLPKNQELFRQAINGKIDHYQLDKRFLRKDGSLVYVTLSVVCQLNDDGSVHHFLSSYIDLSERKKAEEAVKLSGERYRQIINSVDEIIYSLRTENDPLKMEVEFVSSRSEQILGYRPDEFLADPSLWFSIVHPEDKLLLMEVTKYAFEKKLNLPRTYRIRHKLTGEDIWMDDRPQFLFDKNGNISGVFGSARDITKQVRAEEAVHISEARLRRAELASRTGNWELHLDSQLIIASEGASKLYGLDCSQITFNTIKTIPLPEYRQMLGVAIKNLIEKDIPYDVEFKIKAVDTGLVFDIHSVAFLDKEKRIVFGIIQDITDRVKTAEALRKSEDMFKSVFEAANVGKSITMPTGEMFVNKAFAELLGYKREELKHKKWQDITHADEIEKITQTLSSLFDGEIESARFNKRFIHKNGSFVWADISVALRRDSDGKPIDFIITLVDISDRKQAENALKESETLYRTLIEKIPDGVYKSTHEGRFIEVNPAMVSMLGYENKEELLAIDIKNELYFNSNDRESLTLDEMREELGIFRLRKKDGSAIWVEDHGWYTLDETGETFYHEGVLRDITERIQVEDALNASETIYRTLIEKVPDGVYRSTPDGRFIDVNPAMVKMLGYNSKEELLAIDIKTQLYFDPAERDSLVLDQHLMEMGVYRLRKKDGSEIWVEDHGWYTLGESGETLFHEGVMRDITDRKNAEEELKESQLLFRNLTLVSPVGIFRTRADGYTTYVNPRWSELSGLSFENALGFGWLDAVHLQDRERLTENWNADVNQKQSSTAEYRFLKPDGSIVYVIGYAVPEIKDGIITGFIGSIIDITERKQAEEEIQKLNESLENRVVERTAQLEAANKELESFSYTISHDLRTPLRALDGFANFLLEDYAPKLDDEGKRMLRIIIENANRMGHLIDDLLAFSRLNRYEIQIEEINMEVMAKNTFMELNSGIDNKLIDFQVQNIPAASGDPAMIKQVWLNLVSNAIKYSSKKPARVIEVGYKTEGASVIYFVKDNGDGFNMAYANKMFGVFQRLHTVKDFEGTGIGLAIVKRIIQRHGGNVWAEGKVGEGATFYFTLPGTGE